MSTTKPKKLFLPVLLGLLLALPLWIQASDTSPNADVETLKLVREMQNQNVRLENIRAQAIQVNPTADQERMLRLSDLLSKVNQTKIPDVERSYKLNFNGAATPVPQVENRGLREVMYGHGALKNANDSLYFNFLTGMNSGDSIGMDVRITGNEGTNFGNENASWGDPSMLYWIAPNGNLENVPMVATVDDPEWTWTTISWSWAGGNNGQPLAVGNLWAVYARTSHMYVALEVTYVEPWNQYFEFDYIIQTNGSNMFDGEPSTLDMTVNGAYGDTLLVGSNPYFEIQLGPDPYGQVMVFWDGNHNADYDEEDAPIEMYEFMDNDMHDENPALGVFGFTYTDEMADGINYLADDLLFVTFSSMDYVSVPVKFYTEPTSFSISGYTYASPENIPTGGIVVWAQYAWDEDGPNLIVVSNADGYYHLDLPDSGRVMVGTEDYFGMTDGFFPEPSYHEVMVLGHEASYDFYYNAPTSGLEGHVYDENGYPVAGIQVKANRDGPGYSSVTDETGYYFIGLNPGGYDVNIDWDSLPELYVIPMDTWVEVGDFALSYLDLTVYSINNSISGHVYLDNAPFPHTEVYGQMNNGMAWIKTIADETGAYVLPVYGAPGIDYNLFVWNGDEPIYQVSANWQVAPGTTGEDIYLETLTGGLFGHFIDSQTGMYISGNEGVGMMLRDMYTGMEYYGGPDNEGYYEIHVPAGMYELMAGGENYQFHNMDTLTISDQMIMYDIVMEPFSFDARLEGTVRSMNGAPIAYAQVQIGNDGWGTGTTTDAMGHYAFDLPSGFFYLYVWAEGYYDAYAEINVFPGPNFYDVNLTPFESQGAIYGQVYDEDSGTPLMGATVYASSDIYSFSYMTEMDGSFWFNLPNGVYDMFVEHGDYLPIYSPGHVVSDDTSYVDFAMALPDGGIQGYVRDDMGYSIAWAQVILISTGDSMVFSAPSNQDGFFHVPAMNGTYEVLAQADGFEPADLGAVTIADDWVWLEITLYPHQFATPPQINFIMDQPWDQGRNVRMQFWPGGTEWGPFMGYSVWRMTNTPSGPILDFVDYLPNHGFEAYNLVAPTLLDSNAYTSPDHYLTGFFVTGHWDGGWGFIDGLPVVGYSVDNIHPGIPGELVLQASSEAGVEISWAASMADDFQYFQILRATNPDFSDATTMATVEPYLMDVGVSSGHTYYYQVMAVDANGNVGDGTNVVSTAIVSVDDARVLPTVLALSQNYPNPFNPTTSIEFALPEAAQVTVEIYNLLGQRVRTLVSGYMPAGYISTQWDGLDQNGTVLSSGTYIYRLETPEASFSKKMVLMK